MAGKVRPPAKSSRMATVAISTELPRVGLIFREDLPPPRELRTPGMRMGDALVGRNQVAQTREWMIRQAPKYPIGRNDVREIG